MTPSGRALLDRLMPEPQADIEGRMSVVDAVRLDARENLAQMIESVEADAVAAERERIRRTVRVSLSSMPIWAHVDSYGLAQVLKGKDWPADA